ncbi:HlyD family efflux transporter periplasmic adaptor subunit [Runella sp. MFBS21]|uniref:HlyD family efflux transporter periplasmic adaptor subunit n=1 Tax=Runella sp. MFBS21 TaxID=3034018 RepID=UPI0023F9D10A|nr:HlyD family efflux transporter periplasmic adaptor subunit [Runella sp. MFBS21]MDF7816460.1 HlyD family efflux transporter periplasmic adaptor subunit [Runella sp. MFBS21]
MPQSDIHNRYELHSGELQEIIGHVPHWIIRWGITILAGVIAILVLVSHTIRYPDSLNAQALINAKDQPQKIIWYITDPLVTYRTHVGDSQRVKVGDTLVSEIDAAHKTTKPVRARVSGKTYLIKGVENNPKAFMLLVVPTVTSYEVQLKLPIKGAGRVKKGQRVLIKLDPYPDNQYGFLEGYVSGVVPVSLDNHYRANVTLSNGLVTNTGNKLPIQPLLQGTAEIMLDDERLLSRIFKSII